MLAHPLSLGLDLDALDKAVAGLAGLSLGGIEAIYAAYAPVERDALLAIARRHGVLATGGSDYHGEYKPGLRVGVGRGDLAVPDEVLDQMEARRSKPT